MSDMEVEPGDSASQVGAPTPGAAPLALRAPTAAGTGSAPSSGVSGKSAGKAMGRPKGAAKAAAAKKEEKEDKKGALQLLLTKLIGKRPTRIRVDTFTLCGLCGTGLTAENCAGSVVANRRMIPGSPGCQACYKLVLIGEWAEETGIHEFDLFLYLYTHDHCMNEELVATVNAAKAMWGQMLKALAAQGFPMRAFVTGRAGDLEQVGLWGEIQVAAHSEASYAAAHDGASPKQTGHKMTLVPDIANPRSTTSKQAYLEQIGPPVIFKQVMFLGSFPEEPTLDATTHLSKGQEDLAMSKHIKALCTDPQQEYSTFRLGANVWPTEKIELKVDDLVKAGEIVQTPKASGSSSSALAAPGVSAPGPEANAAGGSDDREKLDEADEASPTQVKMKGTGFEAGGSPGRAKRGGNALLNALGVTNRSGSTLLGGSAVGGRGGTIVGGAASLLGAGAYSSVGGGDVCRSGSGDALGSGVAA